MTLCSLVSARPPTVLRLRSASSSSSRLRTGSKSMKGEAASSAFSDLPRIGTLPVTVHSQCGQGGRGRQVESWKADPCDFVSWKKMKDCHLPCVYLLLGLTGYFGFTARTGIERLKEHFKDFVSIAMGLARQDFPFDQWDHEVIYLTPATLAFGFPAFVLLFFEHLSISAADATREGINVNAFDLCAWEHLITVHELKAFVKLVLDTVSPRNESGVRIPTGTLLTKPFFTKHHKTFYEAAPLSSGQMFGIMFGYAWTFSVRIFLEQENADASIWPKQRLPSRLLATRTEREPAYAAVRAVKNRGKWIDGWDLGKKIAIQSKQTPLRQILHPAVRNQKRASGGKSTSADQSGDEGDAAEATTSGALPYFKRSERDLEITDHGQEGWVDHPDVDFGY